LLVAIATQAGAAPSRSPAVKAEFRRLHPCPSTGKTTGACPGYQVDHRKALVCGGKDELSNLHWITMKAHKAKTRAEVRRCRHAR
jgi:5-methylcytosine-specific restriction endonuclease McrA